MGGKRLKKVSLLFARSDFESILRDLIALEIIDIDEMSVPDQDPLLSSKLKTEVFNIEEFGANYESLTLLGTEYTLYITGWIWKKSEQKLIDMVSKYTCAWEIINPTYEELQSAPIMLIRPRFLFNTYKGNRRLFTILSKLES